MLRTTNYFRRELLPAVNSCLMGGRRATDLGSSPGPQPGREAEAHGAQSVHISLPVLVIYTSEKVKVSWCANCLGALASSSLGRLGHPQKADTLACQALGPTPVGRGHSRQLLEVQSLGWGLALAQLC